MRDIILKEVIFSYSPIWGLWPFTDSKSFSEVIDKKPSKHTYTFKDLDVKVHVETSIFPIYSIFKANGYKLDPAFERNGSINNLADVGQPVLDELRKAIASYGQTFDILRWPHAMHCFPAVGDQIKKSFKFSIMTFGDDCPGSSELKSFPVVKYFHSIIYRMLSWDYTTGVFVKDKYIEQGATETKMYHDVGGPSDMIMQWVADAKFDPEEKAKRIYAKQVPIDIVYVGASGHHNPARYKFNMELNKITSQAVDIRSGLYGKEMRDGILGPRYLPNGHLNGFLVAETYNQSLASINYPISSIFNGRLFDLPYCGVVQVLHDKNNELISYGAKPYEHFIPNDGTIDDLIDQVRYLKTDPLLASDMIRKSIPFFDQLQATAGFGARYAEALHDYVKEDIL